MKKIIVLSALFTLLTACSTVQNNNTTQTQLGLANPASEYCIKQGGKLELRTEPNGQVGYCHLANGQVIEEWKLLRDHQATCVAEEAQKMIGQSHLTDEQIKQKTHAEIIRTVTPSQPVTMDYRSNRVTVTIDPQTKKILNATCG